jgi:hypothetical protein
MKIFSWPADCNLAKLWPALVHNSCTDLWTASVRISANPRTEGGSKVDPAQLAFVPFTNAE